MSNKTESERLLTLELQKTQMAQDILEIKENQKDICNKMDNNHQEILKKFERLEWKFASKRVEWVVKWLIALILVAVFTAILAQVIVKW